MSISPHLCFNGQCEEAFRAYQRILGGEIITMLSYGDSPMAKQVKTQWHNLIIHATLKLNDGELLGADLFPGDYESPRGFFVTVAIHDPGTGKQVFEDLAEGGGIIMPFQETFWSSGFGVLADRFGIPWEINCSQPATAV